MFNSFRKSPFFLTQYHIRSFLIIGAMDVFLSNIIRFDISIFMFFVPVFFLLSSTSIYSVLASSLLGFGLIIYTHSFSPIHLALIPISVVFAMFATVIIHNSMHGSLNPKWLRRPLGELFGLIQLVGFADWTVVHTLHHSHSDDPKLDPHPPLNQKFWPFLIGMRTSILRVLLTEYFRLWGQNDNSIKELRKLALFARANQITKVVFWWLLLGPTLFTTFFIPSIVFKMIHYAWFNYATHKQINGSVEILNLNTPLYKIANFFSFGLYYHKNHHANPKLFDPRNYVEKPEVTKHAA